MSKLNLYNKTDKNIDDNFISHPEHEQYFLLKDSPLKDVRHNKVTKKIVLILIGASIAAFSSCQYWPAASYLRYFSGNSTTSNNHLSAISRSGFGSFGRSLGLRSG